MAPHQTLTVKTFEFDAGLFVYSKQRFTIQV